MPRVCSKFDSWADCYDDSALQAMVFLPVHESVLQQLHLNAPKRGRLLDVGCGTGRLIVDAAGMYPLCVGVDPCQRMLEVARGRGVPGTRFVCARAEHLPFATGSFDVVTSTMSLRHWQDAGRGMRELARVLSADGMLVIADADIDDETNRSRRRRRIHARRDTGLVAVLTACGLTVVDHRLAPVRGPTPRIHVISARRRTLLRLGATVDDPVPCANIATERNATGCRETRHTAAETTPVV